MKKMGKHTVTIVFLFILGIVIYFIPFTENFNECIKGMQINEAGEKISEVSLNVEGQMYHYLLKKDEIKITLEIDDAEINIQGEILQIDKELYYCSALYYNNIKNMYLPMMLCLDSEDNVVLVKLEDGHKSVYYVAEELSKEKIKKVLQYFG